MQYKFHCPHCGQRISTTSDYVGNIGVCPGCGNDVAVPPPSRAVASATRRISPSEDRGGALLLALLAFGLSLSPMVGLWVIRSVASEPLLPFLKLFASGLVVICVVGLVVAHAALKKSRHQFYARAVAILSLVVGYVTAAIAALAIVGLLTGSIVLYHRMEPPPDFTSDPFPPDFTSEPPKRP